MLQIKLHTVLGNFFKGIVIRLVATRSEVQSPVRAVDSNFSKTFSLIQLIQLMLAIFRFRFFF